LLIELKKEKTENARRKWSIRIFETMPI